MNRAAGLLVLGAVIAAAPLSAPAARAQDTSSLPPAPPPPRVEPRLSITLGAGGDSVAQPVVRAEHLLEDGVFDGALRNGFPVRYHFRLELWQRAFLFDRLRREAEWDALVRLDPLTGEYDLIRTGGSIAHFTTLQAVSRALATPFTVELPPPPPDSAGRGARFYYIAMLEIESLSEGELEEVERWLRGDMGPAISKKGDVGDALARGVRRLLIRLSGLPRRRLEVRSATFEPGAGGGGAN